MRLHHIPLLCGLLPALAIHLCYLISAAQGHVPWCIPHLDSCTSISAAGRSGAAYYLFKATIIPSGVLMMLYWWLARAWVTALGGRTPRLNRAMMAAGLLAGAGLILYATALGSIGEVFHLQRRLGVTLFYILTFLVQLLLVAQLARVLERRPTALPRGLWRALAANTMALLLLGTLSLLANVLFEAYERIEEAVAWNLTLLLLVHFLLSMFLWKNSGFLALFQVINQDKR